MKNKILCIGEALVDIYNDNQSTLTNPGGAPLNVACSLGHLKNDVAFYGSIGDDENGRKIIETLKKFNVGDKFLQTLNKTPTTQAVVTLQSDGERNFEFKRGADEKLEEINFDDALENFGLIHFGSATALMDGMLNEVYVKLLKWTVKNKIKITFDPNFRDSLWSGSEKIFKQRTLEFFRVADFIKMSEEELELLFDGANVEERLTQASAFNDKALICVTLGKEGTIFIKNQKIQTVESQPVQAIDATGAGDAFAAMMIHQLNRFLNWDDLNYVKLIQEANGFASETVKFKGALEFLR